MNTKQQHNKRFTLSVLLPVLLIVSGCSTFGNVSTIGVERTSELLPTPTSFNNKLDFAEADAKAWVKQFNSSELEALIETGLDNNPNLAATATRILDSEILVNITNSSRLPNLNASFTSARAKNNIFGSTNIGSSFDLGLSSQWELDVWGKLRDQTRADLLQSEAIKQQYNFAKLSLSANIAKAYFNLLTENALLQFSEQNTQNIERIESISVRSFKRGLVNALDVQLARRDLANSKRALLAQQNSAAVAARTLDLLLGDYPKAYQPRTQVLPILPNSLTLGIPAQVLERRPDIQAAALQVLASEADINAARKALLPSIVLNGSIGTSATELSNIFDKDFSVWSILGNLAQPLLNRAALKGQQYEKGLVNANTLLATESQYLIAEQTLLNIKNLLLQNRVSLYVALGGDAINDGLTGTK